MQPWSSIDWFLYVGELFRSFSWEQYTTHIHQTKNPKISTQQQDTNPMLLPSITVDEWLSLIETHSYPHK